MDRLEDNPSPLSEDEIFRLKAMIRYDPSILSHFTPSNDKSMIFHFIVDGPHANFDLAEWMINMEVLKFERTNITLNSLWSPGAYSAVAFAGKRLPPCFIPATFYHLITHLLDIISR